MIIANQKAYGIACIEEGMNDNSQLIFPALCDFWAEKGVTFSKVVLEPLPPALCKFRADKVGVFSTVVLGF